jgi:hypothetical protein
VSKNNRATNPIRNVKVSRRDILRGTAVAAAAGTAVPVAKMVAQTGRPSLGAIDVHQTLCRPGGPRDRALVSSGIAGSDGEEQHRHRDSVRDFSRMLHNGRCS